MLLLRGATTSARKSASSWTCFNTCSSCEEQPTFAVFQISRIRFQYMLLLRGATISCRRTQERCDVSIHAPLARSNRQLLPDTRLLQVSIHAPLARSNVRFCAHPVRHWFQYMLLLRGATLTQLTHLKTHLVSIHAPLARSNHASRRSSVDGESFNTCSSCEEQLGNPEVVFDRLVSIHAPLARSNYYRRRD